MEITRRNKMTDRVNTELNEYQDKQKELTEAEKSWLFEDAKLSLLEGDGLHELLSDLPDAILPHSMRNLRGLLIAHKTDEFRNRLFSAFMDEWENQARERAGL